MNNRTLKFKYSRNTVIAVFVLVFGTGVAVTIQTMRTNKATTPAVNTIELSTLHPAYASVDQMISAPEADLVARAVVLDSGTVRTQTFPGTPSEAPPEVHTDYRLEVKSIVKGKDMP